MARRTYDMTDRMLLVGDNLDLLPGLTDDSVDLCYIDPPFNSDRDYSMIWKLESGDAPPALTESFTDTWHWNTKTAALYRETVSQLAMNGDHMALAMMEGFKTAFTREDNTANPLLAYLTHMAARFIELRRVVKPTGQVFVHVDPTAGHYIKALMDGIFGPKRFLDEIIWHYQTSSGAPKKWLHHNHDLIFRYANGPIEGITWHHPKEPWPESTLKKWQKDEDGRIYRYQKKFKKRYYIDPEGKKADDVWNITLASRDSERMGYPTQKPLTLLEKIIQAATNEGDVVLDCFMGGGTTLLAAEKLKRKWIGMDLTAVALNMTRRRLTQSFPNLDVSQEVQTNGWPLDLPTAREFVETAGEYNFQVWLCDKLDAAPNKKGPDGGIDGRLYFFENGSEELRLGILAVTRSKVSLGRMKDLITTVEQTGAAFGVYVSLEGWSSQAEQAAAAAEDYVTWSGEKYPKIQLMTVEDVLDGKLPSYPYYNNVTYRHVKGFKAPPKHTPPSAPSKDQLRLSVD